MDKRPGIIFWQDLSTWAPKQSVARLGEVCNWTLPKEGMPAEGYGMIWAPKPDTDGETLEVAGCADMTVLAPDAPKGNEHFMPYFEVYELEAVLKKIKELGGTVIREPMSKDDIGTWAVCMDPEGSVFAPMVPDEKLLGDVPDHVGCACWWELFCKEPDAMGKFYGEAIGLNFKSMDFGGEQYRMLERKAADGKMKGVAGLRATDDKFSSTAWAPYINIPTPVDTTHPDILANKKLGAKELVAPSSTGDGRFAVYEFKEGLIVGTYSANKKRPAEDAEGDAEGDDKKKAKGE